MRRRRSRRSARKDLRLARAGRLRQRLVLRGGDPQLPGRRQLRAWAAAAGRQAMDIQNTGSNAKPGIFMLADPTPAMPIGRRNRYRLCGGLGQDHGSRIADVVLRRDDAFPPGEFDDCLVTKEWNDARSPARSSKNLIVRDAVAWCWSTSIAASSFRFELTDAAPRLPRTGMPSPSECRRGNSFSSQQTDKASILPELSL